MPNSVFPVGYFPPVEFFYHWKNHPEKYLEVHENFPKQTYRNRCVVLGANGPLNLVIPIVHDGSRVIKDIQISNAFNWQNQHWKSIQSAYQSSPYFEYYQDQLYPFFHHQEKYLLDFTQKTLEWSLKTLQLDTTYQKTTSYNMDWDFDCRDQFTPKIETDYIQNQYIQVFSDRFPFVSRLSILDLICNMGPASATYLEPKNNKE